MNRFLIPLALVVLVAGCAMPSLFGQQSSEAAAADSVQTVVVREIYHETPVYHVDTVYMAEEPAPVQPVHVEEEHNEYNEYSETYVYVHEHGMRSSSPRHNEPGSERDRERRPADRRRDDGSGRDQNRPGGSDNPRPTNPRHPVKKTNVPATNDRQKSLVPPIPLTPPYQPVLPKRQPPAQGGVPVNPMPHETPRQVPTPPAHKSLSPGVDAVQGQAGTDQAGTSPLAARLTK